MCHACRPESHKHVKKFLFIASSVLLASILAQRDVVPGIFVLRRIDGKKERVAVDAHPHSAQQPHDDMNRVWNDGM